MITKIDVIQGTEEWLQARIGLITGTRAHQLLSSATTRKTLMGKLIAEIDSGESADADFSSDRMDKAHEDEASAVIEYEFTNDCTVTDTDAFFVSDKYRFAGLSPDGLVGLDGGIEIKCLDKHTHSKAMLSGDIDKKYLHQIEWLQFVTGRSWCDYVALCPDLKSMRYWQKRFELTDIRRKEIGKIYLAFEAELEANLKKFGVAA